MAGRGVCREPWGQDRGEQRPPARCLSEAPGFGVRESGWQVRVAADPVGGGRLSGFQTPAPLSTELVPLPPEPPNQPPQPPSRLQVPAQRHDRPSPRAFSPGTSHGRIPGLGTPRPSPARLSTTGPSAWRRPRQRRDFPSAPLPHRAPSDRKRPADRTGRGSGCPAALGHLPTGWHPGAGAVPDANRRDPAPYPGRGGAWRHGPETGLRRPQAPRPVPGAVPCGLAPGAPPLSAGSVALWLGKLITAAQ